MLKDKELGKAIEKAIDLKIASGKVATKAAIAHVFGIKPPSIYDWIKKGSISKDKLPKLFEYFSDVVGPEHWGLSKSIELYAGDFMDAGFTKREEKLAVALPKTEPATKEPPPLDPRHAALIGLFDALPPREQKAVISLLEEKKREYEELWEELSEMRQGGKA